MLRYILVGIIVTTALVGGQLYLKDREETLKQTPVTSLVSENTMNTNAGDQPAAQKLAKRQSASSPQTPITTVASPRQQTKDQAERSTQPPWQTNDEIPDTPDRYINKGIDARPLTVNKQEIERLAIGDTVPLSVPQTGEEYEMSVQEVGRHQNGDKRLKGHLVMNPDYTVVMTEGRTATFATINTPDGSFILEASGSQGWMLSMNDLDAMVDPNLKDYQIPNISRR